jgi:hypothetical protein
MFTPKEKHALPFHRSYYHGRGSSPLPLSAICILLIQTYRILTSLIQALKIEAAWSSES